MSDLTKPKSRKEMMLAAISGDYSGKLPAPITREQEYLAKIAQNGIGSGSGGGGADLTEIEANIIALQTAIDALETLSHAHENKDLLDRITTPQHIHWHSNIDVLQTLTQMQVNNWTDGYNRSVWSVEKIEEMQSTITIYVNATSGSDSNTGKTAATAFATLEKALKAVGYAKKAIIRLAAGTYTIPNKTITLTSSYLAIVGASQSDTIVKGNLNLDNSYLKLFDISLDCTDSEYADTSAEAPIRALSNSSVHLVRSSIYAATKYCISATEISNVYCYHSSFSGCTSYAIMLTGGTSATIYGSADISTKGLCSGYGCRAYLVNNSYFTYKSTNYGLIYVDGQQVLPQTAETAAVLSMGGNV